MVTETRTDYETVETQYEVTICDCCKETTDDDQIETVAVNPEYERTRHARKLTSEFPTSNFHFHSSPTDAYGTSSRGAAWVEEDPPRIGQPHRSDVDDENEYLWMKLKTLMSEIDDLRTISEGKLAADCLFDVCHGCLEGFLDAEPSGDDIETPRIVERDPEITRPKLIDGPELCVGFVLSLIGAVAWFLGFGTYGPGLATGLALAILVLYFIQERDAE